MAHFDFLEAVARLDTAIRIASDADVLTILKGKLFFETGEDSRGHCIQYMSAREEAFPVAVIADGLACNIDRRRAAFIQQRAEPLRRAAPEERFEFVFAVANDIHRANRGHAHGGFRLGIVRAVE